MKNDVEKERAGGEAMCKSESTSGRPQVTYEHAACVNPISRVAAAAWASNIFKSWKMPLKEGGKMITTKKERKKRVMTQTQWRHVYTGPYNQNGRFVSASNWVKLKMFAQKDHRAKARSPIPP